MTRILIADDHAIVRDGLRRILQSAPGIEVAGEAVSGNEVMTQVRAGGFELLLLDMPDGGKALLNGVFKQDAPQAAALYGFKDGTPPPADPILGNVPTQVLTDIAFRCSSNREAL